MLILVVAPTPAILVLLLCAVAVAPLAVAAELRGQAPMAGAWVALYGGSLMLLPSAFGLCDKLHTFFDGLGLYLLSFLFVERYGKKWSHALGLTLFAFALPAPVWTAFAPVHFRATPLASLAAEDATVRQWERLADHRKIYLTQGLPWHMLKRLASDGYWQPGYFSGLDGAFDPGADAIKAREVQHASFVLIPNHEIEAPTPDERRSVRFFRAGYTYPIRYTAYIPLALLHGQIRAHATPVAGQDASSGYTLYETKTVP